jgi:hypothetical protein
MLQDRITRVKMSSIATLNHEGVLSSMMLRISTARVDHHLIIVTNVPSNMLCLTLSHPATANVRIDP